MSPVFLACRRPHGRSLGKVGRNPNAKQSSESGFYPAVGSARGNAPGMPGGVANVPPRGKRGLAIREPSSRPPGGDCYRSRTISGYRRRPRDRRPRTSREPGPRLGNASWAHPLQALTASDYPQPRGRRAANLRIDVASDMPLVEPHSMSFGDWPQRRNLDDRPGTGAARPRESDRSTRGTTLAPDFVRSCSMRGPDSSHPLTFPMARSQADAEH
jgi:hypothetical protein